ncbi:hypothetical protein EHQ27_14185 [Leptospira wolffii]|uniref:hypothetical protein n=1 Tax=Leptospira wolffii TaxID=409998 RepID=UPI00034681FE|nr:hypothetical protein [Leptospira wolffii]TGK55958.1 hypothetical protein EHQ32_16170 [Leptospira wolffii]TGK68378.1 hypothetical protein EHQ27_14185 [Leptospira wolffii]TGK72004.1 hypothetical protein EHQ35_11605 [Leptospira wolffii]TGL27581.1 hypothetical protein EHQ57_14430 [Leptospira wolffii]
MRTVLTILFLFVFAACGGPQVKGKKPSVQTNSLKIYTADMDRSIWFKGYHTKYVGVSFFLVTVVFENYSDHPISVDWKGVYLADENEQLLQGPSLSFDATSGWSRYRDSGSWVWQTLKAYSETLAPLTLEPGDRLAMRYGFPLKNEYFPGNIIVLDRPAGVDENVYENLKDPKDYGKYLIGKIKLVRVGTKKLQ